MSAHSSKRRPKAREIPQPDAGLFPHPPAHLVRPSEPQILAASLPARSAGSWGVSTLPQKITFAQMRSSGVRGLLVYCRNYKCSHLRAIRGRMTGGYRH
jgi:hypothetical protein